jgi:hypothetical protein
MPLPDKPTCCDPALNRFVEKARGRERASSPSRAATAPIPTTAPALGDSDSMRPRSGPSADQGGYITIDPRRVTTEHRREAGPVHVGYQFWNRLGLDGILSEIGIASST